MPHRLFISFAKQDKEFRDALVKHLAPLISAGEIEISDADSVEPGDEERPRRLGYLDAADVIVLLVSPSFVSSEESYRYDLTRALARNRDEKVPMVPVLVKKVSLARSPLQGRRILPDEDEPIRTPSNDEALYQVATGLRGVIEKLPKRRAASAPVALSSLPLLVAAPSAGEELVQRLTREVLRAFEVMPRPLPAADLEASFLKHVGFQNVVEWRDKMAGLEGRVCKIEGQLGGDGTGFLVSPRHVMTNAHVAGILGGSGGRFLFDFKLGGGGASMQALSVSVPSISPKVQSRIEELDYAIFELPTAVGDEPASPGGAPRGFVRMTRRPVQEREPLFILQHPLGQPLKMCVGAAVRGKNPRPRRVYYETNTEAGSSGSPVFTMSWDLVALHHAYDDGANRGIPMSEIAEDLERQGALELLGEPPVG